MAENRAPGELMDWQIKQREFEQVKARAKNAKLRTTCTICGEKAKLNCPCGTTQYCTTECQRIDWRDRGHRKACKKIRDERAAEAARAEAPTPPPSPPEEVFYGPAPRSHADEVRARIAAEHEAARALREANPEREPTSARLGSRCPICLEEWDVNTANVFLVCCCRRVCKSCSGKIGTDVCPLCRVPRAKSDAEDLARLRRHVENEVPEAIAFLGSVYRRGLLGLVKSDKKAAKIWKRAVELGNVDAMESLGEVYEDGEGVKLDRKKSMQLFRMAADRGHPQAQLMIGVLLRDSEKFDEALHYFKLGAEQGLTLGERALGDAYVNGQGVAQDPLEAMRWYERAAAKGDEWAVSMLAKVRASEDHFRGLAAKGNENAIRLLAAYF